MERNTKLEVGQQVYWRGAGVGPSGEMIVVKAYPPTIGSGSFVRVAKAVGEPVYAALPEELTIHPAPTAPEVTEEAGA